MLPLDVNNIFSNAPSLFNQTALDLYAYQYSANKVYQRWCDLIIPAQHPKNEAGVPVMDHYTQIPAMPIGFLKPKPCKPEITNRYFILKVVAQRVRSKANIISKTKVSINKVL